MTLKITYISEIRRKISCQLTLQPNVSPSIGTPLITCSQTQIVKTEKKGGKPSLPLKFLHIWQARNISLQQDTKKTTCGCLLFFYLLLFVTFLCSASLNQLNIPTTQSNKFPSLHLCCSFKLISIQFLWQCRTNPSQNQLIQDICHCLNLSVTNVDRHLT